MTKVEIDQLFEKSLSGAYDDDLPWERSCKQQVTVTSLNELLNGASRRIRSSAPEVQIFCTAQAECNRATV
jgi:hypothetical protein